MNDILRAMGLVGLGNEAAASVEVGGKFHGQAGVGTHGQMANEVRCRAAGDDDLAGFVELGGGWIVLLCLEPRAGAEQNAQQPTAFLSGERRPYRLHSLRG